MMNKLYKIVKIDNNDNENETYAIELIFNHDYEELVEYSDNICTCKLYNSDEYLNYINNNSEKPKELYCKKGSFNSDYDFMNIFVMCFKEYKEKLKRKDKYDEMINYFKKWNGDFITKKKGDI